MPCSQWPQLLCKSYIPSKFDTLSSIPRAPIKSSERRLLQNCPICFNQLAQSRRLTPIVHSIQLVAPAIAPVQPNAVVQQAAQTQIVVPTQPMAAAQPIIPAQQAVLIQPNAVAQQTAQAQTVAPTQPIAPAQPVAPAQQAAIPAQQFGVLINGVPMNRARLRRSVSPRELRRLTIRLRLIHTAAARPAPELSLNQYHEIADTTMGSLLWQLEEIESEREDMEVEEAVSPP